MRAAWMYAIMKDEEKMREIKPMEFPSADFPGADLRVNPDTQYTFKCSCGQALAVPFGWILDSTVQNTNSISSELDAAIYQHLAENPHLRLGSHVDIVHCRGCGAVYVVQAKIDETSGGAYSVKVLGVAEVSYTL